MRNKKGILVCDVCKKHIEELPEEFADNDFDGHGWSNFNTAQMHGCFHCRNRFPRWGQPFIYETYFAGRFENLPDGTRKVNFPNERYLIRSVKELQEVKSLLSSHE